MSHLQSTKRSSSDRHGKLGRAVRRTLNLRVLSITLVVVSAAGIGSYFWRLYQVSRTANALLERAEALEEEGNLAPAADYFRRYLHFHPEDDNAFTSLAETVDTAARNSQQKMEAISLYQGALKLPGVSEEEKTAFARRAAELLLDVRDFAGARLQAERLLGIEELAPDEQFTVDATDPKACRVRALALYSLYQRDGIGAIATARPTRAEASASVKDFNLAEEFKNALKSNPSDTQLAAILARIYREEPTLLSAQEQQSVDETGRKEQADAIIRNMVDSGDTAESLFASSVYKAAYGLPGAEDDLEKALKLKPDSVNLILASAAGRARNGFTEQARALFERAMELAPSGPAPYLALGRLALTNGRPEEALDTCRRGLNQVPHDDVRRLSLLEMVAVIQISVYRQRQSEAEKKPSEEKKNARAATREAVEGALADHADAIRELRPVILTLREQNPGVSGLNMSVIERTHDLLRARWFLVNAEEEPTIERLKAQADALQHLARSCGNLPEEIGQAVQAFGLLSDVRVKQGDWEKAADALVEAASLQPASVTLRLAAGDAYAKAGQWDKSVQYGREAIALDRSPTTRFALANALVQREANLSKEKRNPQQLETALAEPGPMIPLVEALARGPARAALAEWEKAFATIGGPVQRYSKYCGVRQRLAGATSNDDPAFIEADELVAALEQTDAKWPVTSLLRGEILERKGHLEEAAEAYRKALEDQAPKMIVYERQLPLLARMERLEPLDECLAQLQDEIVVSPILAPLAFARAMARGSLEQAVTLARRCVDARPREPGERARLGGALLAQGKTEEAEKELKQAVALARTSDERLRALDGLFRFYGQTKEPEAARAALRELADDPNRPKAERRVVLARGAEALGDRDEAEARYREAVTLAADDDAVQMELVKFLGRSGNAPALAEAETLMRQIVARSPKFAPARQGLAILLAGRGGDDEWKEAQQLLSEAAVEADALDADQRLQATLLVGRGGKENREQARKLLEKLVADSDRPAPEDRVFLARLCDQDGLASEADKHLRAIVEQPSPLPRHLAVYVDYLVQHGDAEAAAPWVAKLGEIAPHSPITLSETARWQFARNDVARIQPTVEQIAAAMLKQCATAREQANLALNVGNLYLSLELEDAAEPWYERMVKVPEPDDRHVMHYVSFLLDGGMADQATEWLKRVEDKSPGNLDVLGLKARWLDVRGKRAEIEALVEPSAAKLMADGAGDREREARAALAIGNLYSSVQLHEAALRWYEQLCQRAENMYQPAAVCLAKLGRCGEGVRLCLEAAKSDPSDRPALAVTAVLLAGQPSKEDAALAEPLLADALKRGQDNVALVASIAGVRLVQEKPVEATALYRRVLKANPNDVLALNNLATALGELPDGNTEALACVDRAIRIAGPRANLLDTKGTLLLRDGKAREARTLLEWAASRARPDPRYQLHLAEACLRSGDVPKARAFFNQARDADLMSYILTKSDHRAIEALSQSPAP